MRRGVPVARRHRARRGACREHRGGRLDAKPILDIAAAVHDDTQIDELIERLTGEGDYIYDGDRRDDGGILFVRGSGTFRTVHVHIVGFSSEAWTQYLRFQDLLRTDPTARQSYQSKKRMLARTFPEDRVSYTAGKGSSIQELLAGHPPVPTGH
jgi:GrpB-like predicted nucleotidyltransferase (UPF0157 family)